MSDSLQPHGLQHDRLPCPSPAPRVYSNSCPSSRWCHPTISSLSPPALNLSQHQGLFKWVSSSHWVAKYWSFSSSISSSNEYSGLIPFRIDWLDLLADRVTLFFFFFFYCSWNDIYANESLDCCIKHAFWAGLVSTTSLRLKVLIQSMVHFRPSMPYQTSSCLPYDLRRNTVLCYLGSK